MKNSLISVIVPIYNTEKYLNRCLDSIANQTYINIEVILVDDGSIDNCSEICKYYESKDKRFKYFYKKNGGLSDARNYGIKHASGEYLTFVDSDDLILPNCLEVLITNLKETNSEISCSNIKFVKKLKNKKLVKENYVIKYNKYEAINQMFYKKNIDNSACGKLFKKFIFDDICFPKNFYFEDLATIYKTFLKSDKNICVTSLDLYIYMQNDDSIMHTINEKKINDLYIIVNEMQENLKNYSLLEKSLNARVINAYFYIINHSLNKNLKKVCKKNIISKRKYILKDENISKKTRIGLKLSYFGFGVVNIIQKIVECL